MLLMLGAASCENRQSQKAAVNDTQETNPETSPDETPQENTAANSSVTEGTEKYRDFQVDNVLHSGNNGDIHYSVFVPKSYDGSIPYALYVTLPGYEGLYFQGVGVNLRAEEFAFEAQKYNQNMIIVAPQLDDWGETSAMQTIALTEYFLQNYNIDATQVYANGYSGGGETMSLVMGERPDLFTAYLQGSSQWDGYLARQKNSKEQLGLPEKMEKMIGHFPAIKEFNNSPTKQQ